MFHRISIVFDEEKSWDKTINQEYIISLEPQADDRGLFISLTMRNETIKFHYDDIEKMMEDYQKFQSSLSDGFHGSHTFLSAKDVSYGETKKLLVE